MQRFRTTAVVAAAVVVAALVLAVASPRAARALPGDDAVRLDCHEYVEPTGDARLDMRLEFPLAEYNQVKASTPNPYMLIRDMASARADYEVGKTEVFFDDARRSIQYSLQELGLVKNRGDHWALPVDAEYEYIVHAPAPDGHTVFYFYAATELDNGTEIHGQIRYHLPKGATAAEWDAEDHAILYELPWQGTPEGAGRLKVKFQAKPRLMTACYKTYGVGATFGTFWVGKTVFRNTGKAPIRDLRIRYQVQGYSEWSPWEKYAELIPGQTCVSVYYPIIDRKVADIRTDTPAHLNVEYEYTDGAGKRHEETDGTKIIFLGINEFIFSSILAGEQTSWQDAFDNAPLIAAWCSRNDPVVKQFAAMANKAAGGVAASSSDEDALKALRACYELMQANNFTYQHPPSLDDKTISFDVTRVQNVKYPRDVIRDRSGTCIDLAICYAAMVNSIGLEPYLAVIPGHCFPVVRLPSGTPVGVEVTGVAGGVKFGTAPFDQVLPLGCKELQDSVNDGRIYLVDVQEMWTKGVSNPELAPLEADILVRWGITDQIPASISGGGQGNEGQGQGNQGQGTTPAATEPSAAGLWGGILNGQAGDQIAIAITIEDRGGGALQAAARMQGKVQGDGGKTLTVTIDEPMNGRQQGNQVQLRGTGRKFTVVETGQSMEDKDVDDFEATISQDGRTMSGKCGSQSHGMYTFKLDRQ